eukprot:11564030-Karenia_brevis.AAC.1
MDQAGNLDGDLTTTLHGIMNGNICIGADMIQMQLAHIILGINQMIGNGIQLNNLLPGHNQGMTHLHRVNGQIIQNNDQQG